MRGKDFSVCVGRGNYRITPAYAGKSRALYAEAKNYEDHPRLCGEKFRLALGDNDFTGSPPPMRGKVLHTFLISCYYRITPAYAGKSCTLYRRINRM